MPKISFLLTAYNFGKYINGAIRSLLAQEGGYDFEIIVIDDCSSDDTTAIVQAIEDERVRFFRNEKNLGVAGSINKAFSLARGEYICRFDGDDEWYPWFLQETVPVLDSRPEIGMVYGDISMINSAGEITVERNHTFDYSILDRRSLLKSLLVDYVVPAPAIMARREAWAVALPLPGDLIYCDFDLALKVLSKFDLAFVARPLAKYRVHEGNIHRVGMQQKKAEYSVWQTIHAFFERETLLTEQDKQDVFQARHLNFGDAYFGLGMRQDARRCYSKALSFNDLLRKRNYTRRLLATYVPQEAYAGMKTFYRKIRPVST